MKMKMTAFVVVVLMVMSFNPAAFAQEKGTTEEARTLVQEAVAYYKAVGKEKAFAEFNKPDGKFTNLKKGLYITVYDLDGNCYVSSANKAMIGKNFLNLKDADGKLIIQAGIALAKAKEKTFNHYRWVNPASKKIEKKATYMECVDDYYMICCGAYL